MPALFLVDPTKELFRWGPVPGRLVFMSESNISYFRDYPKRFAPHVVPSTAELFFGDRLLWTNEAHTFEEAGRKIFIDEILPDDRRAALYEEYKQSVVALRSLYGVISPEILKTYSQDQFADLLKEFSDCMVAFWLPTIPGEIGNYGSTGLLKEALAKEIPVEEMSHALEILTAPEKMSFYQEEEIALSETADIEAHAKNFHWLKNSYGNVEMLPVAFFVEHKASLAPDVRTFIEKHVAEAREKKEAYIREHQLSAATVAIARGLHDAMVWQDERKREVLESLWYKRLLLEETARRLGVVETDLYNFGFEEIPSLFIADRLAERLAARRVGCFVDLGRVNDEPIIQISEYPAEELEQIWNRYLEEKITNTSEFTGIVACKGKGIVRGRVKVLLRPEELESFEEGSVLVAPMTSPEYVFAMKRASAILTDTGGLTSHAAIVSRELGVPCLVGTRVATHLLKDGDEVEVDAEKGIVRKLN